MRFTGLWSLKAGLLLAMIAAIVLSGMLPFSATSAAHAQIYKGSQFVPGTQRGGATNKSGSVRNLFAVIGEVQYPETYELPTGSPSLINFLKLAGGLQPNASGMIRIVRNGRVAQQLYYDEGSTLTLSPGDFVVVDSKVGQGRIVRGGDVATTGGDEQIYLGLVGVLDYPFVMQTSARNATTAWVAKQLGQSEELTKRTRTLTPRSFAQLTSDTPLPANTIIQFDPTKVVTSRLPDGLPRPFKPGYDQRGKAFAQAQPPMNSAAAAPAAIAPDSVARVAPNQRPSVPDDTTGIAQTPLPEVIEDGSVRLDPEPVEPPAGRVRVQDRGAASVRSTRPSLPEPKRLTPPVGASSAALSDRAASLPDLPPEARRPFDSTPNDDEEFVASPIQRGTALPGDSSPGAISELPLSPVTDGTEFPGSDEDRLSQPKSVYSPDAASLGTAPSLGMQGSAAARRSSINDAKPQPSVISKQQIAAVAAELPPASPLANEPVIAGKPDSEPESGGLSSVTVLLLLIGGAGAFAVTWMLLSVVRAEPVSYAVPQTAPLRSALDMLIHNELPLQIEEFRLASSVHIHGRPIDLARLRADVAHAAAPSPHFLRRKANSVAAMSQPMAAGYDTSAARQDVAADQTLKASVSTESLDLGVQSDPATSVVNSEISNLKSEIGLPDSPESTAASSTPAPRATAKYRIDEGAPVTTKAEVPVPHLLNPAATVKPSRVIAEGSDIIDRALERAQETQR